MTEQPQEIRSWRPSLMLFVSFLTALAYLLIPVTNFWVYNLVKVQIWDIVSTCGFAEVFYSTLPDANLDMYSIAYMLGLLMPTIIFAIAYSIDVKNNPILNLFAPCAGAYLVVLMYLGDVLTEHLRPHSKDHDKKKNPNHSIDSATSSRSVSSTSDVGLFTAVDIFNACVDYSIAVPAGTTNMAARTITTENPLCDIEMRSSVTGDLLSISASPSEVIAHRQNQEQSAEKIKSKTMKSHDEDNATSANIPDTVTTSAWRAAWLKRRNKTKLQKQKMLQANANNNSNSLIEYDESLSIWTRLYLPRQIYDFIFKVPLGKVKPGINRIWIWFVTTCYVLSVQGFYFFLNFFTDAFRKVPEYDNVQRIKMFILYILVCMFLKTIIKRIGMYLDCLKENTSSLFFLGEIAGLMFYFTFYRVLFESIVIWWEFLIFQVMHIVSEWILYPCRASLFFYQKQTMLLKFLSKFWNSKNNNNTSDDDKTIEGLGYEDWLDFICLDFGFRVFIELTSGFSMLFYFLLIDYVPWIHYGLKQSSSKDVGSTALLIAIALVVELISAFLMNKYFFIPKNKNIRKIVDTSFRNPKFGFLAFTFCAMELINPLDAFIDAPTFG